MNWPFASFKLSKAPVQAHRSVAATIGARSTRGGAVRSTRQVYNLVSRRSVRIIIADPK